MACNVKIARKPVRNVFAGTAESDITFCGLKKPVYLAACFVLPHALRCLYDTFLSERPAVLTVTMTRAVRLFQLSSHILCDTLLSNVHFTRHHFH